MSDPLDLDAILREMVAEAMHQRMWSEDPTNVLPPLRSDAPPP